MELHYKELDNGRSMYLYYPPGGMRTPFKRSSITVLRDGRSEESVNELLDMGLAELSEKEQIILSFPNPEGAGWNYNFSRAQDDILAFEKFQDSMNRPDNKKPELGPNGIPTLASMLDSWHAMNDSKYLIGIGSGADMACTLAACKPESIAAVFALGGRLCPGAKEKALYAPVAVACTGGDENAREYFIKANNASLETKGGLGKVYACENNPLCCFIDAKDKELDKGLLDEIWHGFFKNVRRTNTGDHGDCEPRMDAKCPGFDLYIEDTSLEGEENPRTWFVHVPEKVKKENKKVPLMIFFHGGSDNPGEAAEMSKFHELGEEEGFITVYPWGCDKAGWNINMEEDREDDVAYTAALIDFMVKSYPVDRERVYLSGFSNGAGHAFVVAMLRPELIAAICPVDSNWPGKRLGPTDIEWRDVPAFRMAMENKENYDYRIPVWYTYGSREPSYPVYKGCSQQHQYDFWKMYNNIEIKPTPGMDAPHPCGCGVPGDEYQLLEPSTRHPHHQYDVQRFYSRDEKPINLYNYVLMREKGHEVAQMDTVLGWEYVRKFKRLADGSLALVED